MKVDGTLLTAAPRIRIGPQQQHQPQEDLGGACGLAYPLFNVPCPTQGCSDFRNITLRRVHAVDSLLSPGVLRGNETNPMEIVFDNVRVPLENVILGEGRGFEIAQGRLGPGRIHHCMRTCGVAEMGLAAIIHRSKMRSAFGGEFEKKDNIRRIIAESRIEITKCRQLCYLAACMMDEKGAKNARKYIAMIKVAAPRMALQVVDEAIQVHGAHGVSQDSRLPGLWTSLRTLRVADGPDIVHMNTIAKMEIGNASGASNPFGKAVSGTNKNIEKYAEVRARL